MIFTSNYKSDYNLVFDPDTTICIDIRSIGKRVFIYKPVGTIDKKAVK
jgi:hypothetical protein